MRFILLLLVGLVVSTPSRAQDRYIHGRRVLLSTSERVGAPSTVTRPRLAKADTLTVPLETLFTTEVRRAFTGSDPERVVTKPSTTTVPLGADPLWPTLQTAGYSAPIISRAVGGQEYAVARPDSDVLPAGEHPSVGGTPPEAIASPSAPMPSASDGPLRIVMADRLALYFARGVPVFLRYGTGRCVLQYDYGIAGQRSQVVSTNSAALISPIWGKLFIRRQGNALVEMDLTQVRLGGCSLPSSIRVARAGRAWVVQ